MTTQTILLTLGVIFFTNLLIMLAGGIFFFHKQRLAASVQAEAANNLLVRTLDQHLLGSLTTLTSALQQNMQDIRHQISMTLTQSSDASNKRLDKLLELTQAQLFQISQQVDRRLTEGLEKTTATFGDIVKRLSLIDQAQQKITELSQNVVRLQDILADKRARGAFGEIQLESIIKNLLPDSNFSLQATLSNGKRVDCLLKLPEPTGNIAIDAKFPLESFQKYTTRDISEAERQTYIQQFKIDIRKHIKDVASKYIIPEETADGAILFIPAEAIFAELHALYPELVEEAHRARVWLASPTTMMAIITTARAVLKDAATKKQLHIIQKHLGLLARDFERFQKRMGQLATHIDQAQRDVQEVHISADKITAHFAKIESAQIVEMVEECI